MDDNNAAVKRWSNVMMMGATQAPSIQFRDGNGMVLTDADGKTYLDFTSGVAVNALGHAHPAIVKAVSNQVAKLGHVSNMYASEPPIRLAEKILELFAADVHGRVFLCNSGAEANEAAFKLARRTGRPNIVAANGSFHGRTIGALALTGQPAKRQPFEPLPGPVTFVDYGDINALASTVDSDTAAVFLEPIQGEGGVIVPPAGYLEAARQITEEHGTLLIFDEVQTGIGRTGAWFAHQHLGLRPDVITSAKGLGGGLPVGACIAFGAAAELLTKGDHASTFGGNPIASAAAIAVLDTIAQEDYVTNAAVMGARLQEGITALNHPEVADVRGQGLLIGLQLRQAVAPRFEGAALEAGFLVNAVQPSVIRLAPPLIISAVEVDAFLKVLSHLLDESAT